MFNKVVIDETKKIILNVFNTAGFYILLFLLCAAVAVKSSNYDYDMWARLIAGMAVVQTGQVLKYDFLSYTPTHPWYDHEWGSSVVFYIFQHYLGHLGLLLLQVLLIFLTMFFLVKTVQIRCSKNYDYKNLIIYFIALNSFMVTYSSLIRCHSFTFLFFIFELYILELIRKNNNYKLLFIFPILFLFWGNMHGGVVSGLGLLVLYTIGEALNEKPFKYYFIAAIICPCMLFINPYGIEFVKFLIKAVTMPRQDVVEWWSIFSKYNYKMFKVFKFTALFYLIVEFLKVQKSKWNYFLADKTKLIVLAVTLFLAIKHVKMMPFFILTGTAFCYEDILILFKNIKFPKYGMKILIIVLTIYASLMLVLTDYRPLVNFRNYPVMEVEFIKKNKIEGKLLTNFGIGSFASYKLYPQNTIYMDGRYEEVYDQELLEDMHKFYALKDGFFDIFRKNKPDIIIMEKAYDGIYSVLKDHPRWTLVFEGINFGVFVDSNIAKENYILPTGDLQYYKSNILDTGITFKGPNRIKIEEINNKDKK